MSLRTPDQYVAALKAEGLSLTAHPAWTEVNRPGPWNPHGVIIHHTGPYTSVAQMIDMLRHGRSDLPGPLCHAGGRPSGVIDLIGWHDANHAGMGSQNVLDAVFADREPPAPGPDNVDGNSAFYGLELIHPGDGKTPWPDKQVEGAVRYAAALCRLHGWDENSVIFHRGWTTRKVDPRGLSLAKFRARVAERLAHKASWSPGVTPVPVPVVPVPVPVVPVPPTPVRPLTDMAASLHRALEARGL